MGRISLLVLDAILINFSFIFAYFFRFKIFDLGAAGLGTLLSRYSNVLIFVTFVWLAIFNLFNLYEQKRSTSEIDEAASVLAATTVGTILLLGITILHRELLFSRRVIVYAWLFSTLLVGLSRIVILEVRRLLRRFGLIANRTLILGAGERGQMIAHKLLRHPEMGYKLIGFLDDDPTKINQSFHKIKVLGNLSEVKNAVRTEKIDNVLVAIPEIPTFKLMEVISACETEKVEVKLIPNILEIMASRISTDEVGGVPLITVREIQLYGFNALLKRTMDLILTTFFLILASPFMLLIALLIKIDSPGPVFFMQDRIGKDGRPFKMFKFRSMIAGAEEMLEEVSALNETEGHIFKIREDPRITRVGKFLRKISLDELPQLFNVLRGEMSLVGPRPPLPGEVEKYDDWHKKRLRITPGMTGLWQVSGRSELPFDEMVRLDIYYIENWSLWLDLKVLLKTIPIVLLGAGAY